LWEGQKGEEKLFGLTDGRLEDTCSVNAGEIAGKAHKICIVLQLAYLPAFTTIHARTQSLAVLIQLLNVHVLVHSKRYQCLIIVSVNIYQEE